METVTTIIISLVVIFAPLVFFKYFIKFLDLKEKINCKPAPPDFKNPFLGDEREREKLWEALKRDSKPIKKEELFKIIKGLRDTK